METDRMATASCALGMLAYTAIMSLLPAPDAVGTQVPATGEVDTPVILELDDLGPSQGEQVSPPAGTIVIDATAPPRLTQS